MARLNDIYIKSTMSKNVYKREKDNIVPKKDGTDDQKKVHWLNENNGVAEKEIENCDAYDEDKWTNIYNMI